MNVAWKREKPTKFSCCDCGKKLVSKSKSPYWRSIPANQKRCRSCSMKYRLELKRISKRVSEVISVNQLKIN